MQTEPTQGFLHIPLYGRDGVLKGAALIDEADAHIAEHRWSLAVNGYAVRRKDGRHVLLHRELFGLGRGDTTQVDHINTSVPNRRTSRRIVMGRRATAACVERTGAGWRR